MFKFKMNQDHNNKQQTNKQQSPKPTRAVVKTPHACNVHVKLTIDENTSPTLPN